MNELLMGKVELSAVCIALTNSFLDEESALLKGTGKYLFKLEKLCGNIKSNLDEILYNNSDLNRIAVLFPYDVPDHFYCL